MSSRQGPKNKKDKAPKGGSPQPQLAREIYTLDDSSSEGGNDSDDSCDESLEIIMPKKKEKLLIAMNQEKEHQRKEHSKKHPFSKESSSPSSTSSETSCDNTQKKRKLALNAPPDLGDSSSDDDDDLKELLSGNIGIRKKKQATSTTASTSVSAVPTTKQKNRNNTNRLPSSQSSNDDEDEGEEDEKSRKKRERELAKWHKQQEAIQKKEAEKRVRAKKREEAKLAKERAKQLEKEQKREQKELADQSSGKFSHKEIVVLIDPHLYGSKEYKLVDTFSNDFLLHSHESGLPCPKSIQWIRKGYLQGGAEDALQQFSSEQEQQRRNVAAASGAAVGEDNGYVHYEHLSQVMMILEANDFLPLLQRVDDHHNQEGDVDVDIDFPKLKVWLDSLISRWQQEWKKHPEKPKLLLLLHQIPKVLDELWANYRRSNSSSKKSSSSAATMTMSSPPTEWDFQDAIHWLLIHHQVETVLCENVESIQSNFHKMTRGLAEAPYVEQVTELQCIKKIKGCGNSSNDFIKAKDVWMRQLQMLPGVSETKARNLAQSYPTMLSLWETYQGNGGDDNNVDDENENLLLLADEFTTNSTRNVKLSDSLYRVMTSDNPNEMIL